MFSFSLSLFLFPPLPLGYVWGTDADLGCELRPQGVGMGRNPQVWLKNGDVVEVELEGVGTCTNKVEFTPARDAKL